MLHFPPSILLGIDDLNVRPGDEPDVRQVRTLVSWCKVGPLAAPPRPSLIDAAGQRVEWWIAGRSSAR